MFRIVFMISSYLRLTRRVLWECRTSNRDVSRDLAYDMWIWHHNHFIRLDIWWLGQSSYILYKYPHNKSVTFGTIIYISSPPKYMNKVFSMEWTLHGAAVSLLRHSINLVCIWCHHRQSSQWFHPLSVRQTNRVAQLWFSLNAMKTHKWKAVGLGSDLF